MPGSGFVASLLENAARIPTPDGRRFVEVRRRGSLRLELYAPRGHDPQQPHSQDELYIVVSGHGDFMCAAERRPFAAGDALFAPAGVSHRFEHFSDDLLVWVIFYGPEGGESPD